MEHNRRKFLTSLSVLPALAGSSTLLASSVTSDSAPPAAVEPSSTTDALLRVLDAAAAEYIKESFNAVTQAWRCYANIEFVDGFRIVGDTLPPAPDSVDTYGRCGTMSISDPGKDFLYLCRRLGRGAALKLNNVFWESHNQRYGSPRMGTKEFWEKVKPAEKKHLPWVCPDSQETHESDYLNVMFLESVYPACRCVIRDDQLLIYGRHDFGVSWPTPKLS